MKLLRATPLILLLVALCSSTCKRQRGGDDGSASSPSRLELPGVDTSSLAAREHAQWSALVTELLAPCPDVAVSIAQCVTEQRDCPTCAPAARFLLRQVEAARPKQDIVEVLSARFDPQRVKTVIVGDSAAKGPKDALVTIVELADFECPGCRAASEVLEKLYQSRPGDIRLVFKHYPIAYHVNAKLAAQAAYAAQQQGRFWPMHKILFENHRRLTEPDLEAYADKLNLDLERFRADMHSAAAVAFINREKQQGESLGLRATPTIYINGRFCDLSKLANPLRDLEEWVELELVLAAGGHPSGAPAPPPQSSASPTAPPVPSAAAPPTAVPSVAPSAAGSAAPAASPGK